MLHHTVRSHRKKLFGINPDNFHPTLEKLTDHCCSRQAWFCYPIKQVFLIALMQPIPCVLAFVRRLLPSFIGKEKASQPDRETASAAWWRQNSATPGMDQHDTRHLDTHNMLLMPKYLIALIVDLYNRHGWLSDKFLDFFELVSMQIPKTPQPFASCESSPNIVRAGFHSAWVQDKLRIKARQVSRDLALQTSHRWQGLAPSLPNVIHQYKMACRSPWCYDIFCWQVKHKTRTAQKPRHILYIQAHWTPDHDPVEPLPHQIAKQRIVLQWEALIWVSPPSCMYLPWDIDNRAKARLSWGELLVGSPWDDQWPAKGSIWHTAGAAVDTTIPAGSILNC